MIVRLASIMVPRPKLKVLLDYVSEEKIKHYQQSSGLVCVVVSHRTYGALAEVLICSLWSDENLMSAFIGDESTNQTLKARFDAIPLEPRYYDFVAAYPSFPTQDFTPEGAD